MSDKSQNLAVVEKLIRSKALHGSESLCKLLRYLAQLSLEHPDAPIKEYQIATELFGRQSDFNPQLDSVVRVQAGRLRAKLAEYYASDGAEDPTVVELAKGSYHLTFHPATPASTPPAVVTAPLVEREFVPRSIFVLSVSILSLLLVASLAGLFILRSRATTSAGKAGLVASTPAPFEIFWKGFRKGPQQPWVIFSNALFVGRPDLGLRYYDAKRDAKSVVFDHYTGVGEVLAIHRLDTVFTLFGEKLRVKRGSLFTLDDAEDTDLIFVGSPAENLSLLEIPGSQEFQFRIVPSGPRAGNTEIVNAHPQPGEASEYLASPSGVPLTEDFAVIALLHGPDPSRCVLILAGTTTLGTQGAVEFVTSEETLATLLSRLSVTKPTGLRPFEALIRVKVARGVPSSTELVAVRPSSS